MLCFRKRILRFSMFKKSAMCVFPVGQCGNQIGCRFWDLALKEHAHVNKVRLTQYNTRCMYVFYSNQLT